MGIRDYWRIMDEGWKNKFHLGMIYLKKLFLKYYIFFIYFVIYYLVSENPITIIYVGIFLISFYLGIIFYGNIFQIN